jgi:hypothetical protein
LSNDHGAEGTTGAAAHAALRKLDGFPHEFPHEL